MFLEILYFILGMTLVVYGADWLVKGASQLAQRLRVSELVIGLVIVAFGTSMPELVVSSGAALRGANDIAIANVVGSNVFNLLFILGVSGLVFPLAVKEQVAKKDIPMSFLAAAVLLLAGIFPFRQEQHQINRWEALVMIVLFALYMFYIWRTAAKNRRETPPTAESSAINIPLSVILIVVGLGALLGGGQLIINSSITLARLWGMSEKLIGITIVAVGTSLPELATSVVAAIHKKSDIAVANVVGSNVFNILFIIPISTFIRPLSYTPSFTADIIWLLVGTLVLFLFVLPKYKLNRIGAAVLLLIYITFAVKTFLAG